MEREAQTALGRPEGEARADVKKTTPDTPHTAHSTRVTQHDMCMCMCMHMDM